MFEMLQTAGKVRNITQNLIKLPNLINWKIVGKVKNVDNWKWQKKSEKLKACTKLSKKSLKCRMKWENCRKLLIKI